MEDCVKQAGGDVEALKTPIEKDETAKTTEARSTDVVVVGSGLAGLSAALSAADEGADVVVLEKMAVTGGTSATAGGWLICVDSELYADVDYDDSLERFLDYWYDLQGQTDFDTGYPDEERTELIFGQTGSTVDWLASKGVNWEETPSAIVGGDAYPTAHNPGGGRALIDEMVAACEDAGIDILLECEAKELTTDGGGTVTGLVAETADSVITFTAPAVILCTGGISANDELVREYSPEVDAAGTISTASAGCDGSGLLMALEVGAGTFENYYTSVASVAVDPDLTAVVSSASSLTMADQLVVNGKGERYCNEAPYYTSMTNVSMIEDGNAPFWAIYDSSNADITAILEEGASAGLVAKGETIEELAASMDVDAAALQATYDRYMEQVSAGSDADFGKDASHLISIDEAPYYAVKFRPRTFGSQGGILTDYDGRALTEDGDVIPGLYAAGADSNRYYYNRSYAGGASMGLYATTGRIAGTAAATDIK